MREKDKYICVNQPNIIKTSLFIQKNDNANHDCF